MKQNKEKINKKLIEKKIKSLNQEIKLTTAVAILFVVIFFVVGYIEESKIAQLNEKTKSLKAPIAEEERKNDEELTKKYQIEAANVLSNYYNQKQLLIPTGAKISQITQENQNSWLSLAQETKGSFLELIVPAIHKNVHLNLILSFNLIEQGIISGDETKIDAGEMSLEALADNYPWLNN